MYTFFKTASTKIAFLALIILLASSNFPAHASVASNRASFKKVEPLLLTKSDVELLQGSSLTVNSSKTGYLTTSEQMAQLKSNSTELEPKLQKKFLDIATKARAATLQCAKKVSVTSLGEATGNSFEVLKDSGTTRQTISSSVAVLKGDASQLVKNRVSQNCILPIAAKLNNDLMRTLGLNITLEIVAVKTIPTYSLPKFCTGYRIKTNIPETEDTVNYKTTAITINCGKANLSTTYTFEAATSGKSYIDITTEEEKLFIDTIKQTLSK